MANGVNRAVNPNRDTRLLGNTPLAVNVRGRSIRAALELAGDAPPTVTRSGTTMEPCLSWHIKGTCFSDCGRVADHVNNTPAEKEALWEWAKTAYS